MSQQEKVIDAFERFIGENVLYQTFDGELFVELPDAQMYATSLLSPAIISIPRPITVPDEVLPNEGKWVFLPNGSTSLFQKNLIVNGFGELGGTLNFSKFQRHVQNDFVEFQIGANYIGEQGYVIDGKNLLMTDSLIPITPGQMYCLEFMATTLDAFSTDLFEYEAGVMFFDADGVQIENNFIEVPNDNLRLKKPLKAGDTYLVTNSQPNFVYGNAQVDLLNNISFLNFTFKNGRTVSNYTRNILNDAYPDQSNYVQVVGNEIRVTLNKPYSGVRVPQNTRIANVQSHGFAKIKTVGQHQGTDTKIQRMCFGGMEAYNNASGNFRISRHAKYMKFFIKQLGEPYFDLLISDVSLKEIYPGEDIAPKGHDVDVSNIAYPEIDASLVPNGYRYWTGEVMCESLDGQWIERPYTVLLQ